MIGEDGTVFPDLISPDPYDDPSAYQSTLNQISLCLGKVILVNDPKKDKLSNQDVQTYDVRVDYVDGQKLRTPIVIYRCRVLSLFGGVADFSHFNPRVATGFISEDTYKNASSVLVLCINGNARQGVILGGYPNAQNKDPSLLEQGPTHVEQYNGIRWEINPDGELKLSFRGATNPDGTLVDGADAGASGTYLKFAKDGSFVVSTVDDSQYLKIDHTAKTINTKADQGWHVETQKNATIISDGLLVGEATDDTMLGTTYRNAENKANGQISKAAQKASIELAKAGALLNGASSGLMPLTGGAPAAPFFVQAGQALIQASQALAQMKIALDQFEQNKEKYLSKKNKND